MTIFNDDLANDGPYRFLRPNPQNPDGEGIVRRNRVFDTYFGIKAGGTAAWLGQVAHLDSRAGIITGIAPPKPDLTPADGSDGAVQ